MAGWPCHWHCHVMGVCATECVHARALSIVSDLTRVLCCAAATPAGCHHCHWMQPVASNLNGVASALALQPGWQPYGQAAV